VHIEEEKGSKKKSSLIPDVQIQEIPQKEQEVESVLDTKFPDAPETQVESMKDEKRSDEPKEKSPQRESVTSPRNPREMGQVGEKLDQDQSGDEIHQTPQVWHTR